MVQNHPTAHGQEAVTQPVETRRRRRTTEIISHGTVTVGHGPAEPPQGPGEFTRLFAEPSSAKPSAPPPPPQFAAPPPLKPPPQPQQQPPPPAYTPQEPGEFTQMFNSPPPPVSAAPFAQPTPGVAPPFAPPPPQQAPPQPPPQQQTARDREMAEFERLFGPAGGRPFPADEPPPKPRATESALPPWPQAHPQPSPQQPPPYRQSTQQPVYPQQPPAPQRPSEFTEFFGSGFTAEPVDVEREQQRAAAEPSAPPRRPFQQASEFTRMFGPGAQGGFGQAPTPPPAQGPADWGDQGGSFTMFGPKSGAQGGGPPPMADMTQHAGPSEYTRMISGGGSSMPGAGLNQDSPALKSGAMPAMKQAPGQQPGPAPSRAGMIGIALAIGGIVIALIVALVLLLTSK